MSPKGQSIILGGTVTALITTILAIPQIQALGCIACFMYIGAGLIAVWHYTSTNELTIRGGEGAGMGALSGIVAGVVGSILGFVLRMVGVMPSAAEVLQQLEDSGQLDQADGNTADMIYKMVEFMTGIGGMLVAVLFAVILGTIGGAIGAAVFKKGPATPNTEAGVI